MKKITLGYLLLSGLLLASCTKQNNTKTMGLLLKTSVSIKKDIGTAD